MTKVEFKAGDRVAWKYGTGKATGHVVEKLTEATKLSGRTYKANSDEPKYRVKSEKSGKDAIRNPETLMLLEESTKGGTAETEEEENEGGHEVEDDEKNEPLQKTHDESILISLVNEEAKAESPQADASLNKIETAWESGEHQTLEHSGNGNFGPSAKMGEKGVKEDIDMEMPPSISDVEGRSHSTRTPHRLPHEEVPQPDLDAVK